MSNKKLFERSQGRLFKPTFSRNNKPSSNILNSQGFENQDNSIFKNTNLESTSSYRYGDKRLLVSTQQLRVDWSRFENHTFFHSAVANVNESFDRVINFYPFEKSEKNIEKYEDELTGFEKYVLGLFPKNVGYLNFSGTVTGESLSNGTQISVKDRRGVSVKAISDRTDGAPVLDPNQSPFSIEMFIRPASEANDNQIIVQKFSSLSNHFTLALSQSSSTSGCIMHFGITSGSNHLTVTGSIKKGEFSHVSAFYDRFGDQRVKLLINDVIHSSSLQKRFENLRYSAADLTIGAGSNARIAGSVFTSKTTFSGSIDDLRYFHSVDPVATIKKRKFRSFYPSAEDPTLKLYYRFNEPYGSYTGNNIVLDSSGNSLHERIVNFEVSNRLTGSDNPVLSENVSRNPVLFPTFDPVKALNTRLLSSASLYDSFNPNIITKLVPEHYFQEATNFREFNEELDRLGQGFHTFSSNIPGSKKSELLSPQLLIKLLLTYAKFFDELKLMIDGITSSRHTVYEDFDTTPDVFLEERAKDLNIPLPKLFSSGDVAQYLLGLDLGAGKAKAAKSLNEIQNLIWRRILSEAPKMKLHKGTVHSVKSVFRQTGIEPDNIFTFREYGGSKEKSLNASREIKRDVFRFLSFTGSFGKETTTVDAQGYPTDSEIPKIKSGFLSGSRIQTGRPEITRSKASTTITIGKSATETGLLAANDTLSITDATGTATTFTFKNAGTSAGSGLAIMATNTVANAPGTEIATAIESIVNSTSGIQVTAAASSNAVVLTQDNFGPAGNQSAPTESSAGANNITGSAFTGGAGFEKRNNSFVHGISSTPSDGLLTSGSFTYEAFYDWEQGYKGSKESLVRLQVTGSSAPSSTEACIVNLVAANDKLTLYLHESPSKNNTTELFLTGVNVFDKNVWYVSFGRKAGHDLNTQGTSSFFLRAAKQLNGDIVEQYATSSITMDYTDSLFSNVSATDNISGSFLVIGSQSLQTGGSKYLNNSSVSDAKITNFHGLITNARFFSKNTTRKEYLNRARNYDSYGVENPLVNYSFSDASTGSFERLVMYTDTKQNTQTSDASGNIRIFDFSQNNFHFQGSNFKSSANVMKNLRVEFEVLSEKFDLNYTRDKVRVRSFQDADNLEQSYFATTPPVYEVLPSEESIDDNRLSLDMSVMKGLNDNILKMFNNFDPLDDALGQPNLIFAESYGDLKALREIYFNNVIEVLDLQKYRDLFKWIDNSFTDIIFSVLPRTTNFLGINFIYESNVLERNRFKYLYDEIYMKSGQRDGNRGNIFLSQFVGKISKH